MVGPLKWMAPEALIQRIYSTKSDVWSYGVTLVEILTSGQDPYPGIDPVEAATAVMQEGLCPTIPGHCPIKLGQLLHDCFSRNPDPRPEFKDIITALDDIQNDLLSPSS